MRSVATGCLVVSAPCLLVMIGGRAQERVAHANDPSVGLKAGVRDAGTAIRSLNLAASLPMPDGFFDPNFLSQNEIDAATLIRSSELNAKQQLRIVWPATSVVARECRSAQAEQRHPAGARPGGEAALDRAGDLRTGRERDAAGLRDRLDALATELERDADAAGGRDQACLRSLAARLKRRAAKLR